MLEAYLMSLAAGATVEISKQALQAAAAYVQQTRPDLETRPSDATASGDLPAAQRVFEEAVGVIVAEAGTGAISMDKATLNALRGIKFDHQHGVVEIGNSRISSDVLVTGGSEGATGQTTIGGNTSLKSKGTEIQIGDGASIQISGNAKIEQT